MARRGTRHLFAPGRKKRPGLVVVLLIVLIALGALYVINAAINKSPALYRQAITVPDLPRGMENLSILHLSDLHGAWFGEGQEDLKHLVGGQTYDMVIMSGDMVGRGGRLEPLLKLVEALPPDIPRFLIAGDDDPAPILTEPHGDSEVKAPYLRELEALGVVYLDRPQRLELGGGVIWVIPELLYEIDVDAALFSADSARQAILDSENPYAPEAGARLRATEYQIGVMQAAQAARTQMRASDLCIAVAHVPPGRDEVISMRGGEGAEEGYFPGRLVLVLAGHLNAGQVRLPGRGPVHVPPNRTGASGWFPPDYLIWGPRNVLGVSMYTSPGLGVSGAYKVPVRLFNRPGVTLITFTSRIR